MFHPGPAVLDRVQVRAIPRHGDSFSTGRPVPEKASGETGPSTPPLIKLLEAGKWTDYPEISGMSSQCIQESNKTLPAKMVQLGRLQYSHLKVSISTTGTVVPSITGNSTTSENAFKAVLPVILGKNRCGNGTSYYWYLNQ